MTTSTPRPRQASVGALFGGRHYAHIAGFLNAAGTHRETIEQIAYILAADNPHFNAEVFGREAGLESARESYTQDELKANLVTAAGITERLGLRSAKRVADWRQRYSDFPEPFLGGTRDRGGPGARQAWYFWPEVEAFLERHELPKQPRGRQPPRADAGPGGRCEAHGLITGPVYELARRPTAKGRRW